MRPAGTRVEYKVTRGSWETVEKDAAGGELPNRVWVAAADALVEIEVARWADR